MTSLIRVDADAINPRMGSGCLILLCLPWKDNRHSTATKALELNRIEVSEFTRTPFIGSWCEDEQALTHVSFLPNAIHCPGALVNLVMGSVIRARWVTESIFGFGLEENFDAAVSRKQEIMQQFLSANAPIGDGHRKRWWEIWK